MYLIDSFSLDSFHPVNFIGKQKRQDIWAYENAITNYPTETFAKWKSNKHQQNKLLVLRESITTW